MKKGVANDKSSVPSQESGAYMCKICRKPITGLDAQTITMMEFFDMQHGGVHAKCLQQSDEVTSEHQTLRELAPKAPTIKKKGKT